MNFSIVQLLKKGAGVIELLGIMVISIILVALAEAFIEASLGKPWTRIADRVARSYIFADGPLMLGWLIRGTK